MAINKYYIDTEQKYHEILLAFEYIPEQYTGLNLAQVLNHVLIKYKIQNQILVIIINNADNNIIIHKFLIKLLQARNTELEVYQKDSDKNDIDEELDINENYVLVSCLAHAIQLRLKELLKHIKANPNNKELKKN